MALSYCRWPVAVVVLVLLSACASTSTELQQTPPLQLDSQAVEVGKLAWWRVRYRMVWPEGESPQWYAGPLIAEQIVKPILMRHAGEIRYWRFHRRAARDKAGHLFSFMFYAERGTAALIIGEFSRHPLLPKLKSNSIVKGFFHTSLDDSTRQTLQSRSDPAWTVPVQRSWPMFINGVSAFWLDLVDQYSGASDLSDYSVNSLQTIYRSVNERLDVFWREEAKHALLHHTNGIFGYSQMPLKLELGF